MERSANLARPGHGPEVHSPAHPDGRRHRPAKPLIQELYHLYTAERQFAFDLRALFHRATAIPARLALSDQRRVATRQILRLERTIQMATGAPAVPAAASMTPYLAEHPLGAAQAATAEYQAAVAAARLVGQAWIADLLEASLREKRDTIIALTELRDDLD